MWYSVHFTMSGTLVTTDNSKSEYGFQRECVVYNSAMDKKKSDILVINIFLNWEIGTRPKQKLSKQSLNHKEKMRTQSK